VLWEFIIIYDHEATSTHPSNITLSSDIYQFTGIYQSTTCDYQHIDTYLI